MELLQVLLQTLGACYTMRRGTRCADLYCNMNCPFVTVFSFPHFWIWYPCVNSKPFLPLSFTREYRPRENVTFLENGTKLSALNPKSFVFLPEMSVGDPEVDLIRTINIPVVVSAACFWRQCRLKSLPGAGGSVPTWFKGSLVERHEGFLDRPSPSQGLSIGLFQLYRGCISAHPFIGSAYCSCFCSDKLPHKGRRC